MRTTPRTEGAGERGFMLVGVVMFMLALTILGLSLFALSSYEAQFFTASASREQSLQNAESGMELVKALLQMSPQRLENAQLAVGQRGVTRALAYQWKSPLATDTTSRGNVNWDSTMVVVVTAWSGGVERTLQARYIPTPGESPYKRLLTAGLGIAYNAENGTPVQGFELRGKVWQFVDSPVDTAWTALVSWPTGRPLLATQPALPQADAFVDARVATAASPTSWSGDHGPYDVSFSNASGGPKFFRSPPSPHDGHHDPEYDDYSFYVNDDLTIKIKGTVVWVVPQGACFRQNVTVVPLDNNVPSTLVLVAKANQRDPGYENRGLWFQGGLTSTSGAVRVFLVSEGDIGITHRYNHSMNQDALRLSVLAGGDLELGGPSPGYRQRLQYDASVMDALADQLQAQGALPQLSASTTMSYVIARSSWAETTPK